jgi:arylsulfatase A-like enzyme
VSKRFLSPYAPEVAFTPALARFAERAVVFTRHHTEAGSSGTAYASLLTGAQADHHGVFQQPAPLRDELDLLPEAYAAHGYETYFWRSLRSLGYIR